MLKPALLNRTWIAVGLCKSCRINSARLPNQVCAKLPNQFCTITESSLCKVAESILHDYRIKFVQSCRINSARLPNQVSVSCQISSVKHPNQLCKDAEYAKKKNQFIKVEESTQITTTNRNLEFWRKYNVIYLQVKLPHIACFPRVHSSKHS